MTRRRDTPLGTCLLLSAGILALQAIVLRVMGRPLICACGHVDFWYGNPAGAETSQQLTDWYTFTHITHGFAFYGLLWLIAPRLSVARRFVLMIALEAGWEMVENTPFVIALYRQSALAQGYGGDSVVNSVCDTLAAAIGFVLARILPVWAGVALVGANEAFLAYMIRDNLALNIVQLVHPSATLSHWQTGGAGGAPPRP